MSFSVASPFFLRLCARLCIGTFAFAVLELVLLVCTLIFPQANLLGWNLIYAFIVTMLTWKVWENVRFCFRRVEFLPDERTVVLRSATQKVLRSFRFEEIRHLQVIELNIPIYASKPPVCRTKKFIYLSPDVPFVSQEVSHDPLSDPYYPLVPYTPAAYDCIQRILAEGAAEA